jgi:cobalt/nickel transport system permease protein
MGAAPVSFGLLWAMHISDGVLAAPWLAAGFALSGLLALLAAYRVRDEEIPRIALLSAAFFVATLMHLRLGPTSVHLLLNGLVGVVLGRRAPLAILIGLALQAILLGHGGFTTIGVNACVMTLPALLAAALFALMRRFAWLGRGSNAVTWLCGCLLGMISVLTTLALQAVVLLWGGAEDWSGIAPLVFYTHLPLVFLEGAVLGFTVNFLARVKPDILGLKYSTSALAAATLTLLLAACPAYAHRPCADYTILADRQVQIDGWFDPGDVPMKGAQVQIFRPGHYLLTEGRMDDNGTFVFRFVEAEPLEVIVNAGAGHRTTFLIPREKLEQTHAVGPRLSGDGPADSQTIASQRRDHADAWREPFKDALIGISFLFSVAAFLLSWRTSRRLRSNGKGP